MRAKKKPPRRRPASNRIDGGNGEAAPSATVAIASAAGPTTASEPLTASSSESARIVASSALDMSSTAAPARRTRVRTPKRFNGGGRLPTPQRHRGRLQRAGASPRRRSESDVDLLDQHDATFVTELACSPEAKVGALLRVRDPGLLRAEPAIVQEITSILAGLYR